MFLDYMRLLSIGARPEFSLDHIIPMAFILLAIVIVVVIGYKIKEEIGAIIAMLICGFIILHMKDLLKIFF